MSLVGSGRARDADVARGLAAGEAWAIAETWQRFAPMVLLTAERSLGSRAEAEDVVQEVFCLVFRKAKTLRDPDRLRSFIYSFAVRVLKAELRRRKVRGWFPFFNPEAPRDFLFRASDFESRDLLQKLCGLLDRLTPRDRLVFVLRRMESMTVDEIAATMDISISTVKRSITHASTRLSRWVEADPELADLARGEHWGGDGDFRRHRRRRPKTTPMIGRTRPRSSCSPRWGATPRSRTRRWSSTRVSMLSAHASPAARRGGAALVASRCSARHPRSASSWPSRSCRLAMTSRPSPEVPVTVSRIEGGTELEGGYLSQSGVAGVKVLFSEGSTFALTSGTRGRLRSVADDGAHLGIEHGTVSLSITQSRTHHWLVEAGPFLVTVKGTVFTVSWDPASERFELRLRHGRVVVSGPVVDGSISLQAGQRLVVSLPRSETVITAEQPDDAASASAGPAPLPPTPAPERAAVANGIGSRPARPVPAASSAAARGVRARGWAANLATGHWDRILADVDRDGVEATLENAGSDDLFALADAARYRRQGDLSRAALLAERRRFPRAPRAFDALFLLGRAEELREHGTEDEAIAWSTTTWSRHHEGPTPPRLWGEK